MLVEDRPWLEPAWAHCRQALAPLDRLVPFVECRWAIGIGNKGDGKLLGSVARDEGGRAGPGLKPKKDRSLRRTAAKLRRRWRIGRK